MSNKQNVSPTTQKERIETFEEFYSKFDVFEFRLRLIREMRDPHHSYQEALTCIKEQFESESGRSMIPQSGVCHDFLHPNDFLNGYQWAVDKMIDSIGSRPMDWGLSPFDDDRIKMLMECSRHSIHATLSDKLTEELLNSFDFNVANTLVQMMVECKIIPHK